MVYVCISAYILYLTEFETKFYILNYLLARLAETQGYEEEDLWIHTNLRQNMKLKKQVMGAPV